jgi:hypothetical protein
LRQIACANELQFMCDPCEKIGGRRCGARPYCFVVPEPMWP